MDAENLTLPLWSQPDQFPKKPDDAEYGYMKGDLLIGCSREDLIDRCRSTDSPRVALAWAPEVDRVVTVVELPFLFDAIQERTLRSLSSNSVSWIICTVVYGFFFVLSAFGGARSSQYHLLLLLSCGVIPLAQGWWQRRQMKSASPETFVAEISSARYAAWLQRQKKPVTLSILGVILAVFGMQVFGGLKDSIDVAGLTKTGFPTAGLYRFWTATLMHASGMHFIMNAVALLVLGMILEALLGGAALALVFTGAALAGSIFSFALSPATSVGSSGGIMGVIGCLAIIGFHHRQILPPKFGRQMLFSVAMVAFTGLMARQVVDNAAHAGGLLAGAMLGWLLVRSQSNLPLRPPLAIRCLGFVSLAFAFGGAVLIARLLYF